MGHHRSTHTRATVDSKDDDCALTNIPLFCEAGETRAVGSPPGTSGRLRLEGLETSDDGDGACVTGLGDGEMDGEGTGVIVED